MMKNASEFLRLLSVVLAVSIRSTALLADVELQLEELLTGNDAYDRAVKQWFDGTTEKIIGGKEASAGQFPWQVSIGVSYISDPFHAQYCGGSIYKADWIITAAHCVNELRPYKIKIVAGAIDIQQATVKLNAQRIIVYPGFVHQEQGKDIALIQLRKELPFSETIGPIRLIGDDSGFGSATRFTIAGWGQTMPHEGSKSAKLQFIEDVPYVSRDVCNLPLSYDGRIKEDMICAGFSSADEFKDACKADSGGAQIIYSEGLAMQSGIVSWGEGCAHPLKYGVYTRIATYADWIERCTNDIANCVLQ